MTARLRSHASYFRLSVSSFARVMLSATLLCTAPVYAQTFTVLHSFTDQGDGGYPLAGVSIDRGGNLFGTNQGGIHGILYELAQRNGNWILNPLLKFDGSDGAMPTARPAIALDGTLYGNTCQGGDFGACEFEGCGVVYHLIPPPTPCRAVSCFWNAATVWLFDLTNGDAPTGDLLFDAAGNIYGTTLGGGAENGVVYELTPSGSGFNFKGLYEFRGNSDGSYPESGVVADAAGNLYGTTFNGGGGPCNENNGGCGTVFELSPTPDGVEREGDLCIPRPVRWSVPDGGNRHRSSRESIWSRDYRWCQWWRDDFQKLTPSGDSWTFSLVYSFTALGSCSSFSGPGGTLLIDAAGNLYGNTSTNGTYGYGAVFMLAPSGNSWTYSSLHDFTNGVMTVPVPLAT